MRIVMTIGQLAVGGAELQAVRLAAALVRRGHAVAILTKKPIAPIVASRGPNVSIRPMFSLGSIRGVSKYVFAASLFADLVRRPPDVIHVHQLVQYHLVPALVAGILRGRPVLVKASGAKSSGKDSDLLFLGRHPLWGPLLVRFVAKRAACAVAVSREICEDLRGARFARVVEIPNGVELPNPRPRELRPPLNVLFVGRLHALKGADILLRAWAIIEKGTQAWLRIVGDGPERRNLVALSRELNLDRVRFEGERDNPFSDAQDSVFALPSRSEGLSNSLLEAMGLGLPVVASAVGAAPEVLSHGRSGLLVPSEDPAALAAALKRVLSDVEFARSMGREAFQTVSSRYGIDEIAAAYERLYAELLAG